MEPKDEYIRDSLSSLEDAVANLTDGRIRPAINSAYHSAMQAARAALMVEGIRPPKGHAGLRSRFSEHFVKNGAFPREVARNLGRTARLRERADYLRPSNRSIEDARRAVHRAHEFVVSVTQAVFPDLVDDVPSTR